MAKPYIHRWAIENKIIAACHNELGTDLDYLIVIHWFRRGGAELETLLLINALQKIRPNLRIGLITTLDRPSEWEFLLPPSIKRVHFGRITADVPLRVQEKLLFRLLREQAPKVIHNIISPTCWDVFVRHGHDLAKNSSLLASSFCANYPTKKPEAFVFSHLPRCKAPIKAIFVDNRKHALEIKEKKKDARVHALRFPVHNDFVEPKPMPKTKESLNLLWAGRLDYQKRIDVLYFIALLNPQHRFHVWGEFVSDAPNSFFDVSLLSNLDNVEMYQKYDRLEEIPLQKFDAFLYTSAWDGMPNILIEAATKGLPIIAPDVGGVREFINPKTGYLVSHAAAVGEYCRTLSRIAANPEQARKRALYAQKFLRDKHSTHQFVNNVNKILTQVGV